MHTTNKAISNDFTIILPSELERLILEMAAFSGGPKVGIKLMLVAKYVYDWIRPTLFAVFCQISVTSYKHFPNFEKYPSLTLEDIGPFARHLLIGNGISQEEIALLLISCPNVYNFALWSNFPLCTFLPYIQQLPLRRLSADLVGLTEEDLCSSPFPSITHLDVTFMQDYTWVNSWSLVSTLPNLTHLSINTPVEISVVYDLFQHCPNLSPIVMLRQSGSIWYGADQIVEGLTSINDVRLVLVEVQANAKDAIRDWENGTTGKLDTWLFAERISIARRRKYFDDNSQQWVSKRFKWVQALGFEGWMWYISLPKT